MRPLNQLAWVVAVACLISAATTLAAPRINIQFPQYELTDAISNERYTHETQNEMVVAWYFWGMEKKQSVQQLKDFADAYKRVGKLWLETKKHANEKPDKPDFQFITVNIDPNPNEGRKLMKTASLPVGLVAAGAQHQWVKALQVTMDDAPIVLLQIKGGGIVWAGPVADTPNLVAQALGLDASKLAKAQEDDGVPVAGAARTLADAIVTIDEKQEFTAALETLVDLDAKEFQDPEVLGQAMRLLARLKDPSRSTQVERAMERVPKAAIVLNKLNAAVLSSAERALPGRGSSRTARPTRPAPEVDADAIADRKLEAADDARDAGDHAEAYERYKQIVEQHARTPAGEKAFAQVEKYESDAQLMAELKSAASQKKARSMLNLAKGYAQAGRRDLARAKLEELLREYGDSDAAAEATQLLRRLR